MAADEHVQPADSHQGSEEQNDSKSRKMAAVKTAVAKMFRSRQNGAEGNDSDGATGNAFQDGKTGLIKAAADFLNPRKLLKSLLVKLLLFLAPTVLIFMAVIMAAMVIVMFVLSATEALVG